MNTPTTPRPKDTTARRTPGATWPTRGLRPGGPSRYEIGDLRRPRAMARLPRQVADQGLAVFDGVHGSAALLAVASSLMSLMVHPDAGPDGVTTLTDLGPAGDHPGTAGFSHHALPPHTDRSGVPAPPALVMLTCAAGVFVGGASLLTDGAAVHADLAVTAPATFEALHRPRSVLFGGSNGHLGAVFVHRPGVSGRCQVRLRLDELVTFAPDLDEHLPILMAAIDRHTVRLTLTPGRGYLLDNHRWLHARTAYTGARTLYRLLGDPLPDNGIHPGIPLAPATDQTDIDAPHNQPHDRQGDGLDVRSTP